MAVAASQGVDGFVVWVFLWVWKFHSVLLGQFEDEFRCQTAFEVDVVFAFGEAVEEVVEGGLAHCIVEPQVS